MYAAAARVVVAILLPCLAFAVLTFIKERSRALMPEELYIGLALASCVAGFVFLARSFRRHAIWVGLVYFPVMMVLLFYVGMTSPPMH